jgi:hypothetical protein
MLKSVAAARLTAKNITRSFHASRTVASNIAPFKYQEVFDLAPDLTTEGSEKLVSEVNAFLKVELEALRTLSAQAMRGKRCSISGG